MTRAGRVAWAWLLLVAILLGGCRSVKRMQLTQWAWRSARPSLTMSAMTTEHASVCPLDCPDTCSLSVTVDNARIVRVRGSRANPYTAGVICTKVATSYPDWVHGPGRLLTPLRRVGAKGEGRFAGASWDEALDIIHDRFTAAMAAHGPESVLPLNYAGPHGMLAYAAMDLRFFHKLGASLLDRSPLCGGIRSQAWMGTFGAAPGIAPEQVRLSTLVIAWGNNVTWSNLHLTPIINAARRTGAKVVVVDPKRTKIAEQADLHIALKPGTDVVLAWAVAAELERRGGLDHGFIDRHVEGFEAYMEQARRVSVSEAARICEVPEAQIFQLAEWYHTLSPAAISVGNGLERNQNGGSGIRAIFALPALAGKFGVPGGGLVNGAGHVFPKTLARLQRAEPVIAPVGESLPNTEIFRRLAARFGFTDPAFTASDADLMDDAIDPADPRLGGVRPSQLPTDKATAMTIGGEPAVLFKNVFPKTPSGKVELASGYLETKYGQRLPSFRPYQTPYPLILITPASDERVTSTFGGLKAGDATPPLEMHPDDARARGLEPGSMVRVWNELGEVHLPLEVTDAIRPGVVCSLKGAWMRTSDNGQTVSALAPGHHADLCGGACYNDTRVEVAAR